MAATQSGLESATVLSDAAVGTGAAIKLSPVASLGTNWGVRVVWGRVHAADNVAHKKGLLIRGVAGGLAHIQPSDKRQMLAPKKFEATKGRAKNLHWKGGALRQSKPSSSGSSRPTGESPYREIPG